MTAPRTEPQPDPPTIAVPVDLLLSLVDLSDCSFDHHGGCQEHGYLVLHPGEKCPQFELKELLTEAVGS